MRRRSKIDDNQPEIVEALRAVGCDVLSLAAVGKGCPDLLVACRGVLYLLEVKDGSKSPSRRRLTPDQVDFHATWRGEIHVVNDIDEAYEAVGLL